jgi:branched-chain amino acid transport system permease protein
MNWNLVLQLVLGGLIIGTAYALMALGLTIIYGMMHVVNMAHGEFYMLAAYLMFTLTTILGINFYVSILLTLLVSLIAGALIERVVIRPVIGAPITNSTLLTIGLAIFLKQLVLIIWGPMPQGIIVPFSPKPYRIGPILITPWQLFILIVTVAVIVISQLVIQKTKLGVAMRATFQDREAAALAGINIGRIYTITFVYGSALAALGGVLLGPLFSLSLGMGSLAAIKAWAIVLLGGLANFPGAIIGGLILGVAESLGSGLLSASWVDAYGFGLVIIVLLFRPHGLLGGKRVL